MKDLKKIYKSETLKDAFGVMHKMQHYVNVEYVEWLEQKLTNQAVLDTVRQRKL